ncbi:SDR family NAD(P)-dependent oxidoreductase [Devosia sp. Root635]|uniref:SDR family NAD(P)-dependent oxidoreductase n=1 Tax=Devosia sp. Root635 TaxID=1736575 RepID=UPI0006F82D3D|nr:glucose 1-dehydrogenase [Devosia sp. Root635]KRA53083.1 short-chain dehydrogenase [Devosia sp. Root635]
MDPAAQQFGEAELDGKVAIVTGAGRMRSIGRRIATTLARAGASVVVTGSGRSSQSYPDDEKAAGWRDVESVAEEIRQLGGTALTAITDIADEASVDRLIADTLGAFGRLDILVNNAAMSRGSDRRPVVELDIETLRKVYSINVEGTFLMSRAAARTMLAQGSGGNIVNISTVASRTAGPRLGAYASSKAAINALGRVMALELASENIRVNTICPGFNDTSRLDDLPRGEQFDKMVKDMVPLGWADDGTQVAELTLFLASDRAKWITGQTLMADGGRVWGQ